MGHWRKCSNVGSVAGVHGGGYILYGLLTVLLVLVLLVVLLVHAFAAEQCPIDRPIKKTTLIAGGVVTCTAVLCAKLVCPKNGVSTLRLEDGNAISADCYYVHDDCNKCSYPEPVDICLSEDEAKAAEIVAKQ